MANPMLQFDHWEMIDMDPFSPLGQEVIYLLSRKLKISEKT